MLINSLLASSFQQVISSVMSTKGGISSSSDFSPFSTSFTKGVYIKDLGFRGLFGQFWLDVAISESFDNACHELVFSSEVVSFAQGMVVTCVVSAAWTSHFVLLDSVSVSSTNDNVFSCSRWPITLHEILFHECVGIHYNLYCDPCMKLKLVYHTHIR